MHCAAGPAWDQAVFFRCPIPGGSGPGRISKTGLRGDRFLNFNVFVSLLLNGLAMGTLYALIAMGLILLIRAVGVLNFAQGDLLMFGAFITGALVLDAKLPIYIMAPVAIVCFVAVGLIFTFTVYWPTRNAKYRQATTIATMGASIVSRRRQPLSGALCRVRCLRF
jgi:branched-chain amino acid transport system permease protein